MESNGNSIVKNAKPREEGKSIEGMGMRKLLELIRHVPEDKVICVELPREERLDGRNKSKV